MTILDDIFAYKEREVERQKKAIPLASIIDHVDQGPAPLDFISALVDSEKSHPALIAEVKRASPSHGSFECPVSPIDLARIYMQNGASALSVLTDEYFFRGKLDYLQEITRQDPRIPVLRKDFVFDPYQIYEARSAGADAVLLIVSGLAPARLRELHTLVTSLGMAALVEIHSLEELEVAMTCSPGLIGINNRNLHDFSVSLATSLTIRPYIPSGICVVAESGIHTSEDVKTLRDCGIDAILVGEALVTAQDIGTKVRSFLR